MITSRQGPEGGLVGMHPGNILFAAEPSTMHATGNSELKLLSITAVAAVSSRIGQELVQPTAAAGFVVLCRLTASRLPAACLPVGLRWHVQRNVTTDGGVN